MIINMTASQEVSMPFEEMDAIDEYFECVTACSLADEGIECITQCVQVHLKVHEES